MRMDRCGRQDVSVRTLKKIVERGARGWRVLARQLNKPYAVVINGVPPRRDNTESPFVREARAVLTGLNVPVWSGQITQRNNYSLALAEGEGASEYDGRSEAAVEVAALWGAIEKSVRAIHGAYEGSAMHKPAAA